MNETTDAQTYDRVRVGRCKRTVEVAGPDGPKTVEKGSVRFQPINHEDIWPEEDEWRVDTVGPDDDGSLTRGVVIRYEKLGILEPPEPMDHEEIGEWLREHPEKRRKFLDESIESDTTAEDLLEGLR